MSESNSKELAVLKAELTAAKEKYLQVCAQHGRLVDQVYEEDGETLKHVAAEAELASYKLWAEVEMADLMEEAVKDVAEWGAYASEYFQEKWNLEGTLHKWQDRAAIKEGK